MRYALRLDSSFDKVIRQKWQVFQEESVAKGAPPDPRQFARLAVKDECFAKETCHFRPLQNIPLPPSVIKVKAVGFWQNEDGDHPHFPWPQTLVKPNWAGADLRNILVYLNSGHNALGDLVYCGWSSCRFKGCIDGEFLGSGEKTDGEWGWPDGLAHYVARHSVVLPRSFVDTMKVNHWTPPPWPTPPLRTEFDFSFWVNWAIHR